LCTGVAPFWCSLLLHRSSSFFLHHVGAAFTVCVILPSYIRQQVIRFFQDLRAPSHLHLFVPVVFLTRNFVPQHSLESLSPISCRYHSTWWTAPPSSAMRFSYSHPSLGLCIHTFCRCPSTWWTAPPSSAMRFSYSHPSLGLYIHTSCRCPSTWWTAPLSSTRHLTKDLTRSPLQRRYGCG